MAKEAETLSLAEIKHNRRAFQTTLTEKEKAFLIEAARRAANQGENWSLASYVRDAAIDAAERELKRKFREG